MSRPGRWLRIGFARICAKQTMERLIDPIVADIQTEHADAVRAGHRWRAPWICISGYAAFWKAVGLHTLQSGPRALWNGLAADSWTLGRTMACSLAIFVAVTLLLSVVPFIEQFSRFQNGLKLTLLVVPQAIPFSMPIALALGIVCGVRRGGPGARSIHGVLVLAIAATLLAFAGMLLVPAASQAFLATLEEELVSRGITQYSLPRGVSDLSLSELATGAREYEARGFPQDARQFRRAYHLRFALPAATFVLSLFALAICGFVRGRTSRIIAIVLTLGAYWAILALGGESATVSPIVSVWAPNLVFTAIAVALLHSVLAAYRRGQYA